MTKFFEVLPATLAWGTIVALIFLSWWLPSWVAIFIILFDIYWLLKTLYLALHLRHTFTTMRANLTIDWLSKIKRLPTKPDCPDWQEIYHLVLLPFYQEPHNVVRETFLKLLASNYPKKKLIVVLGVEARAGTEVQTTAAKIQAEFSDCFHSLLVTIHPANLPDEIPGKGSNETWMAKKTAQKILDPSNISYDRVIASVFDIDTQIYPNYFALLSFCFISNPKRLRASFQPIPLFNNNTYDTNVFGRVVAFSASFWQMMQQARPERLTSFSSHATSFQALHEIGFWQTNIVSEDSRIFWQGLLHYQGDWRVVPLYYPVAMDAAAAPGLWQSLLNIYRQQRRWAWGVENIPYMLDGWRRVALPLKTKLYWSFNTLEGFHSWATNALMIFALGWLPVIIGRGDFTYSLLSYSLPEITRFIINLSMIGIATSAILSILLLPPKPDWFRKRHYVLYFLQWILMPFTLIIFGAFPALEAQTRLALGGHFRLGFWVTPKFRPAKESNPT